MATSTDTSSRGEKMKEECKNLFKACYNFRERCCPKEENDDEANTELEQQQRESTQQMEDQRTAHQQELQEERERYEEQLRRSNQEIDSLKKQLRASQQTAEELRRSIESVQQYDFIFPNYKQSKAEKKNFTARPMYTHPGGYKFRIDVHPHGTKAGASSHISVQVWAEEGEYDEHLKFPVKFVINLQLQNQLRRDKGHHMKPLSCVYKERSHGIFIGSDFQFINLSELDFNESKQTQYVKDDRLWFRITAITMH